MRALARRISRIEAAKLLPVLVPSVLRVGMNETKAEAYARFAEQWPERPANHMVLCVPAKPRTKAERALWAQRFKAHQLALVDDARRERVAVATDTPALMSWCGTPVPPKGRSLVHWKPNA